MASLYEINEQLLNCIDLETGEIIDTDKFDDLQLEKDAKIENIALWYKNLLSEAKQYKMEKDAFADKCKSATGKADRLKKYLESELKGNKFRTIRVNISYRKSATLEYDGTTELPDEFLKYSEPTIDKTLIKETIADGREVPGCTIVEHNNIQIK